jgi:tryptophan synthase beta chain
MSVQQPNSFRTGPDERGHFGIYGGRFVAETLMPLILDLDKAYAQAKADPAFGRELEFHLTHYVGRPSPLYHAERMTEHCRSTKTASGLLSTKTASGLLSTKTASGLLGTKTASGLLGTKTASGLLGAKIYFKREDLNHTGAHKVNNVLGQIMLARRMGKPRIIAETGAGMHGVATATLCAKFGLQCVVYMGAVDVERQQANVLRMKALGAEVRPVTSGSNTLKDAMNEALRDWVTNVSDTFYCIGTVAGPHPYPMMVRDFQSIIGNETREQMMAAEGRLPDSLIACIGGGSNAMGLFHPFLDDAQIEIYGVEAAGHGLESGLHAASIAGGRPGVLHGNRTYLLMNQDGQINEAHSISAGLDYPGIGPEHAWLNDIKRVQYLSATDDEAVAAFGLCSRLEGIIPALEPAHALARVLDIAPKKPADHLMVVNLSGRGDKDLASVDEYLKRHKS